MCVETHIHSYVCECVGHFYELLSNDPLSRAINFQPNDPAKTKRKNSNKQKYKNKKKHQQRETKLKLEIFEKDTNETLKLHIKQNK